MALNCFISHRMASSSIVVFAEFPSGSRVITEDDLSSDEGHPTESRTDDELTFELMPRGSSKGNDVLLSSDGHTYTINGRSSVSTYWICSKSRGSKCKARVRTTNGNHFPSGPGHNHNANVDENNVRKLIRDCKEAGTSNLFASASNVVEDVLNESRNELMSVENLPTVNELVRKTNRKRSACRPQEPQDKDFEIDQDFVEGFLKADVHTDSRRILLFANENQMRVLYKAKRWYCDGTFRVVKDPFYQLFTVHAFVKKEGNIKQVPLMFIFMTGKSKRDYRVAFQAIKDLLQPDNEGPQEFVIDYEAAIWGAIRSVFPNSTIKCCSYHYAQAIYRKIQDVGLQKDYVESFLTKMFCKQLMALIYLPPAAMAEQFNILSYQIHGNQKLQLLFDYVYNTWMTSENWSTDEINVYEQPIRSNNDVEGWHRRLNSKAKQSISFYSLISLLQSEADMVEFNIKYLKQGSHIRIQRSGHLELQRTFFALWDFYKAGDLSSNDMLIEFAKLIKQ